MADPADIPQMAMDYLKMYPRIKTVWLIEKWPYQYTDSDGPFDITGTGSCAKVQYKGKNNDDLLQFLSDNPDWYADVLNNAIAYKESQTMVCIRESKTLMTELPEDAMPVKLSPDIKLKEGLPAKGRDLSKWVEEPEATDCYHEERNTVIRFFKDHPAIDHVELIATWAYSVRKGSDYYCPFPCEASYYDTEYCYIGPVDSNLHDYLEDYPFWYAYMADVEQVTGSSMVIMQDMTAEADYSQRLRHPISYIDAELPPYD